MKQSSISEGGSIQRSVLLPRDLAEEARRAVPEETARSFNQLVVLALRELVQKYRDLRFERVMSKMAADPAVQKSSNAITRDFKAADSDGL